MRRKQIKKKKKQVIKDSKRFWNAYELSLKKILILEINTYMTETIEKNPEEGFRCS